MVAVLRYAKHVFYLFLQNYLYKIKRFFNIARWLCWGLWLCQGLPGFCLIDNKNFLLVTYQFWIQNTLYKPFYIKLITHLINKHLLSDIWLPYNQLWVIVRGDSLTDPMLIAAFTYLNLTGRVLQQGWITKFSWTHSGVWIDNLLILTVMS